LGIFLNPKILLIMKKISVLMLMLLTAFSFRCSDLPNEPTQTGMNPDLKKEMDALSVKLNNVWVAHWRTYFSKHLLNDPSTVSSMLDQIRASLDSQHQIYFDALMKRPEMQKMVTWTKLQLEALKNGTGRIEDVWDFGTIASAEVQQRLDQLHTNVDNTIAGMEGQSKADISAAITTAISDAEFSAYQSTTLTQGEKDAFGTAASVLYSEVSSLVDEFYGSDIPPDQTRMQGFFSNFRAKLASIVLAVALFAVAGAIIGAVIVATIGVEALGAAATVDVFGWTVGFASVSGMIGGGLGLVTGTGLAADNKCLTSQFDIVSCSI
jgi:hypothetical protein